MMTRVALMLDIADAQVAAYLEELCWTLPGMESVTYRLGKDEALLGLEMISSDPQLPAQVQAIIATENLSGIAETFPSARDIAEEDWAESWKQYWHVSRVLPDLVIQPSWEDFTPAANDIVLRLDPGSAFGTGTHETTQLMLYLLSQPSPLPARLLDVGTGSGILAMAAAKRGVKHITAIDNDPEAVRVALENSRLNNVTMDCRNRALETFEAKQFDSILANILAPVIIDLMPQLKRLLAPGGQLMLSGITNTQVQTVKKPWNTIN